MQISIRGSFVAFIGAALIGGSLSVACVTEDEDPADGTGGTGSGGETSDTGGVDNAGGTTDSGGSGATGATGSDSGAVACPAISAPLLTDFTYDPAGTTDQANFGTPGESFAGGTSFYPDTLVSDVTGDAWHLSGTVDNWAGFGFYWQDDCNPLDASAFQGFRFTISGTMPAGRTLEMWVGTSANTVSYDWLVAHGSTDATPTAGTCVPASDNQYDGTCDNGVATVAVEATAQTVELTWSDFTGGTPESTVDASQITGFGFYPNWGGDTDTAYDFDITIDDFGFIE